MLTLYTNDQLTLDQLPFAHRLHKILNPNPDTILPYSELDSLCTPRLEEEDVELDQNQELNNSCVFGDEFDVFDI